MEECVFFSIAIDSALVRNEHVFSCFVRFTFEDCIIQTPLFFEVWNASTCNEIARMVFNKLIEKHASFEKLSHFLLMVHQIWLETWVG